MKNVLTKVALFHYLFPLSIVHTFVETVYKLLKKLLPIFVVATIGYTVLTFTQTGFKTEMLTISLLLGLLVAIRNFLDNHMGDFNKYYHYIFCNVFENTQYKQEYNPFTQKYYYLTYKEYKEREEKLLAELLRTKIH